MEFIGVFSSLNEFYENYYGKDNNELNNYEYVKDFFNAVNSIEYLNTSNMNGELLKNLKDNYSKSLKKFKINKDNEYGSLILRYIDSIDEMVMAKISYLQSITSCEIVKTRSVDENNYKSCVKDIREFSRNINFYITKLNEMYINYRSEYYKTFLNILELLKDSQDLMNISKNLEESFKKGKGNPNVAYIQFMISGREQFMYAGDIIKNSMDFYLEDFNINIERSILSLLILMVNYITATDFSLFKKEYKEKTESVKEKKLNEKIQEFNLSYIQEKENIESRKTMQLRNLTQHIEMRNKDPKSNREITEQIRNNTIKMISEEYENSVKSLNEMKHYVIGNIKADFEKYYNTDELDMLLKNR